MTLTPNTRRRIRKAVIWAGIPVTLLCFLGLLGTNVLWIGWRSPGGLWWNLWEGSFTLGDQGHPFSPVDIGFQFEFTFPDSVAWRPSWKHGSMTWQLTLPLWMPTAIALAITMTAWIQDLRTARRARAGNCPKCNYSLSGLSPTTPCPECGALPAPPIPPPPP